MQVQSLLQRWCAELTGAMVLFQNQKLLCDHHSMTDKIAELEDKIRNNPNRIELRSLHLEVSSLRKEREKQTMSRDLNKRYS